MNTYFLNVRGYHVKIAARSLTAARETARQFAELPDNTLADLQREDLQNDTDAFLTASLKRDLRAYGFDGQSEVWS